MNFCRGAKVRIFTKWFEGTASIDVTNNQSWSFHRVSHELHIATTNLFSPNPSKSVHKEYFRYWKESDRALTILDASSSPSIDTTKSQIVWHRIRTIFGPWKHNIAGRPFHRWNVSNLGLRQGSSRSPANIDEHAEARKVTVNSMAIRSQLNERKGTKRNERREIHQQVVR